MRKSTRKKPVSKRILTFIIGIIIIIIQMSLTNFIGFRNISVNFLLIYTVYIALYNDKFKSSLYGAVFGLTKDFLTGGVFGVCGLSLFIISYLISYYRNMIYRESQYLVGIITFLATIIYNVLDVFSVYVMYNTYSAFTLIVKGVLVLPVLNGVIASVIYIFLKKHIEKLGED